MSGRRLLVVLIALFSIAGVWSVSPAPASPHFLPHRAGLSPLERVSYFRRSVAADRRAIAWLESRRAPRTLERVSGLRWYRAALRWHTRLLAAAERRLEPRSWLEAVSLVGRYFGADVAVWERSCSQHGSEGGWGRWFPNSQGSGAGGWLQFKLGTFESVIDHAIARARSRGMFVPASTRSWYSPLGQALAGMQMLADGRRGEWAGWGC